MKMSILIAIRKLVPTILLIFGLAPSFSIASQDPGILVPANEVLTNLNSSLKKDPNDVSILRSLAHAEAVAAFQSQIKVGSSLKRPLKGKTNSKIDYRGAVFEEGLFIEKISAKELSYETKGHLSRAIIYFTKLVEIEPSTFGALLGRGWIQAELGNIEMARKDLLRAFDMAWNAWLIAPRDKQTGMTKILFENYVSIVGTYTLKILDPEKDKSLVSEINAKIERSKKESMVFD